jgi:hypothetical protein
MVALLWVLVSVVWRVCKLPHGTGSAGVSGVGL